MAEMLSLAITGLGEFGTKCLEALPLAQNVCLVAVADRNATLAEQVGRRLQVPAFTDHRLLLTQTKPAILLIATPPPASVDLIRLAARNKIHVLKPAPLGRTLDEATALVAAMQDMELKFGILSPRRFNEGYAQLLTLKEDLGTLFLARAQHVLNWGRNFGWRGDSVTAGGGALLEAGYELLDLLVLATDLPEEVYAVAGKKGRPHMLEANGEVEALGIYDTDDTAVAVLRYKEGLAGVITTSWVTSPAAELIMLHGHRGSVTADPTQCILRDTEGQVLQQFQAEDRPLAALARQITRFANAIALNAPRYDSSALEHLLTMAVVEAAYLSNRTGQPENPRRLLQTRGFLPVQCRAAQPMVL